MRVATRRQRAAWRVFGGVVPGRPDQAPPRRACARSPRGSVPFATSTSCSRRPTLTGRTCRSPSSAPSSRSWPPGATHRDDARVLLIRELDSDGYRRWVDDYRDFVRHRGRRPSPVAARPSRTASATPPASRIRAAYEQVRGYEPVLRWADVETLHELRIAGKWLRYTLEFVREALGDDADAADRPGHRAPGPPRADERRRRVGAPSRGRSSSSTPVTCQRRRERRDRALPRQPRARGRRGSAGRSARPWRGVAGIAFRRALGRGSPASVARRVRRAALHRTQLAVPIDGVATQRKHGRQDGQHGKHEQHRARREECHGEHKDTERDVDLARRLPASRTVSHRRHDLSAVLSNDFRLQPERHVARPGQRRPQAIQPWASSSSRSRQPSPARSAAMIAPSRIPVSTTRPDSDPDPIEDGLDDRRAGREEPDPGLAQAVGRRQHLGRRRGHEVAGDPSASRSRRSSRSGLPARRSSLSRFVAVPPTKTTSAGWRRRRPVERLVGGPAQLGEMLRGRRIAIDDPTGQPARPDLHARGPRQPPRTDLDELARAAADVDDQDVRANRPARGQPDEGQERFLLVLEDGQRLPGPAETSATIRVASARRRSGSVPMTIGCGCPEPTSPLDVGRDRG